MANDLAVNRDGALMPKYCCKFECCTRMVYHINHLFIETGDVIAKTAPHREHLTSLSHSDDTEFDN